MIGARAVRLYPLYHPAAALYTRSMEDTLRADFERIPQLLSLPAPERPPPLVVPEPQEEPVVAAGDVPPEQDPAEQLGLF